MKKSKIQLAASLEAFNEGPVVMADHTVSAIAQQSAEASNERKERAKADAIVGAETDIASLESLLEAMNDTRDVGMESWSAQFAHIQLDSIQKRYGIDGTLNSIPSLECFGGRQARLATTVSMEAVSHTIAQIKAWIEQRR